MGVKHMLVLTHHQGLSSGRYTVYAFNMGLNSSCGSAELVVHDETRQQRWQSRCRYKHEPVQGVYPRCVSMF